MLGPSEQVCCVETRQLYPSKPSQWEIYQHVLSIVVNALFSAEVMLNPHTLFTLIHILAYVQWYEAGEAS